MQTTAATAARLKMEPQPQAQPQHLEMAKCECCGLTEECTIEYIAGVRARCDGRWICGLCCEAVDDEVCRSDGLITTEEALNLHANFYKKFRSSKPPVNPTDHLISAVLQLLRRGLDSPRSVPSSPTAPRRRSGGSDAGGSALARSTSCFSTLAN